MTRSSNVHHTLHPPELPVVGDWIPFWSYFVMSTIDDIAWIADADIAARAAADLVVPADLVTDVQPVVARPARESVVAEPAGGDVGAVTAGDRVAAIAPE